MKKAIIIPAYNEETTIREVIQFLYKELPEAFFYIIDNNSNDDTNKIARQTLEELKIPGDVIFVKAQGKGNAMRVGFNSVEADIYILTDADSTYRPGDVYKLIEPVVNNECDMAVGDRLSGGDYYNENKRMFHGFGNRLVRDFINILFQANLKDIMSGYRVFNKAFIDNLPVLSKGFEVETEITLHSLDKKWRIKEIPINYKDRESGNPPKLNTFRDGFRILGTIFWVFKDYKPMEFFGIWSILFFLVGGSIGLDQIIHYIQTGNVSNYISAICSSGFFFFSFISFAIALILGSVVKFHKIDYFVRLNHYYSYIGRGNREN